MKIQSNTSNKYIQQIYIHQRKFFQGKTEEIMDWLWHTLYIAIIILQYKTFSFCKLCEKHRSQTKQKEKNKKIREKMEAITRTYHPAEENFENYMEHFKKNIKKAGIIYKVEENWPNVPWYEDWDEILKRVLWDKICENVRITASSRMWPDNQKKCRGTFIWVYGRFKTVFQEH